MQTLIFNKASTLGDAVWFINFETVDIVKPKTSHKSLLFIAFALLI